MRRTTGVWWAIEGSVLRFASHVFTGFAGLGAAEAGYDLDYAVPRLLEAASAAPAMIRLAEAWANGTRGG